VYEAITFYCEYGVVRGLSAELIEQVYLTLPRLELFARPTGK
jgi:hypothetical protein